MEKKTNKAKLEFFKFLRKSAESQGYSLYKIGGNCALSAKSIKYTYYGIFVCSIYICDENSAKSYGFREKRKNIRKNFHFSNFC